MKEIFEGLVRDNQKASQELERRPEPESVTNQPQSVSEYNRVLNTNMVGNYTSGLELIHRVRPEGSSGRALDLCCGPAHLTLFLHRYLGYQEVMGLDLAPNMIEVARANADQQGLSQQVRFAVSDISSLDRYSDDSHDLVTFTNSAHHLDSLNRIGQVLQEADGVTSPEGIVLLTDVGRLKTKELTERFIELAGNEFKALGMPYMFEDFYNSMYAAWTTDELRQAVPASDKRDWIQMVPSKLSNFQAIIGLPKGRQALFLRPGRDWFAEELLRPESAQQAWAIMKDLLETAHYDKVEEKALPKVA